MDESSPLLDSDALNKAFEKIQCKKSQEPEFVINSNVEVVSSSSDEHKAEVECKVYWYRWYICLIFGLLAFLQGAIWNTWGPIDESSKAAFGFSSSEVELLTNWGPITFIVSMPFFMWFLDTKGLRLPTLFSALLIAVGSGLRCLPFDVSLLKYFIHAGQFLNGIACCVVMAVPPLLSNVWFPPHERITATAVSTLLNYMGSGCAYIIGVIVDVPSTNFTNTSNCLHVRDHDANGSCHEVIEIRKQINAILYFEFAVAMVIFISMLVFFPTRPPLPPSMSAALPRIDLKAGLWELRKHRQFWVVALVIALVIGTWNGWTGVMPIVLKPLNIDQSQAGLLGFIMSIAGGFTGMLVSWFTDKLKGRMKLVLTILFALSLLVFFYFIVVANKWIKVDPFLPNPAEVWTICILLGFLVNASIPLGMEMAADAGYPICEGTSTSIVVWLINILSFVLLFLLGFLKNALDANYIIFACLVVSVPALIFFTSEQNRRLNLDTHTDDTHQSTTKTYGTTNPNYKP